MKVVKSTVILGSIVACLTVVLLVAGLSHLRANAKPTEIVVVLPSPTNPYWVEVMHGAEQAASTLGPGYQVEIQSSADMDASGQIELLRNFRAKREVKAVVFGPANDTTPVAELSEYTAASIPIIVVDTPLNPTEAGSKGVLTTAFIGSDNVDGGRKAGTAMAAAVKNKRQPVLVIEGSLVHQSAQDRTKGFLEAAQAGGLQVVVKNGEWRRAKAQELVSSEFTRRHYSGIFAENDDMALGAVAALKQISLSKTEWPVIIGYDATRDGLSAVRAGDMYGSMQQNPRELGEKGVRIAANATKGIKPVLDKEWLEVSIQRQ